VNETLSFRSILVTWLQKRNSKRFFAPVKFWFFAIMIFAAAGTFMIASGDSSQNITTDSSTGLVEIIIHDTIIADTMKTSFHFPPKNILLGRLSRIESDSIMVPVARVHANREGMLMHRQAYESFVKMHNEARNDGISLVIVSAFRDFDHQKRIWENKWHGRQPLSGNINAAQINDLQKRATEILRFSAMPGTSRHHWGTDIDINSLNNNYFNSGKGKKEYEWLLANAHRFGFYQPYTDRAQRGNKGYEEEKWHWSYLPVAKDYLRAYSELITYPDIAGFAGSDVCAMLDVITNYVLAIDPRCLEVEYIRPAN
jgi:zinc D-Ala-D-Ala carboxypeptidase